MKVFQRRKCELSSNAFDLFDHSEVNVFKQDLVDDLWMCCVRESDLIPHRSREDIVQVLKLAVVYWSRTPYLWQVILGDRQEAKDLVHYSIELLSEKIADTNKQLIIEFVCNLIQIDPNDPLLVPRGDRLLSRRPANTATT
jgi:hypothetical protein